MKWLIGSALVFSMMITCLGVWGLIENSRQEKESNVHYTPVSELKTETVSVGWQTFEISYQTKEEREVIIDFIKETVGGGTNGNTN